MVLVRQKSGLEIAVFTALTLWYGEERGRAQSFVATISDGWLRRTCKEKYSLGMAVGDKCYHFYGNPGDFGLL